MSGEAVASAISVVALVVSCWTAYLQMFRRGTLLIARPRGVLVQEAAVTEPNEFGTGRPIDPPAFTLVFEMPLAFANTGARLRAIEDLRLRASIEETTFVLKVQQLRPADLRGDGRPLLPSMTKWPVP
jgi:hypothetical protein